MVRFCFEYNAITRFHEYSNRSRPAVRLSNFGHIKNRKRDRIVEILKSQLFHVYARAHANLVYVCLQLLAFPPVPALPKRRVGRTHRTMYKYI